MMLLIVAIGIIVSLVVMLIPGGGRSKLASDTNKLIQIGKACMMYRQEHDGEYPSDFSDLGNLVRDADVFVSHHDSRKVGSISNVMVWTSFEYVKGLTVASPNEAVLAYLPPRDYGNDAYAIVLFVDGSAKYMTEKEFSSISLPPPDPPKDKTIIKAKGISPTN